MDDVSTGIWVAIVVLVVIVGGAWLSARSGNLADVDLDSDRIKITPRGFNKFWSFRRGLSIPLENVEQATYVPYAPGMVGGLRWPGTAIPGIMTAGTYLSRGKAFFLLHRGENALVLDLKDWDYRRVIVDTTDPDVLAERIEERLESRV